MNFVDFQILGGARRVGRGPTAWIRRQGLNQVP